MLWEGPGLGRFRDRVDELMLGWLPPLRLLMGFLSPKRLLLFRGLTMVEEEEERSFLSPLVRSFERSLILVRAPRGFSGGRLVALELALAREVLEARVASWERFVLLVLLPVERRSNTFEPEDRRTVSGESLEEAFLVASRSMSEFFLFTGFLRSRRLWPGRMLPSFSPVSSTDMMGTLVTYFPSTSSES